MFKDQLSMVSDRIGDTGPPMAKSWTSYLPFFVWLVLRSCQFDIKKVMTESDVKHCL